MSQYDKRFSMPKVHPIRYPKTNSWPLEPVQQNESTNEGNILIHEDIEERQLGNDTDDPFWSEILKPYYGDLKTVLRILSVQSCRHDARRPFDSRKWIIPGLGLWHLRLNMLRLILKIHWGDHYSKDSSTLQWAADHWRRSNIINGQDFTKMKDFLIHSYQARITALTMHVVASTRGYHLTYTNSQFLRALKKYSIPKYQSLLTDVINIIHSPDSKRQSPTLVEDEVMENHLRFMRHMEVYFLLRHAIKSGDIGMLRQALRDACVMFQAPDGNTFNYAAELIRLIHLYCSEAADVALQEAMLTNSLVNLQCREGKCFETDRLLEYLNGVLKEGLNARRNSTKRPDDLIAELALTVPYMLQLRVKIHGLVHRVYRGDHPEKSAAEDIRIMAAEILRRDMTSFGHRRFSAHVATDLLRSGAQNIGANVDKYNEKLQMGAEWDPDTSSAVPVDIAARPGSPTTQLMNDIT